MLRMWSTLLVSANYQHKRSSISKAYAIRYTLSRILSKIQAALLAQLFGLPYAYLNAPSNANAIAQGTIQGGNVLASRRYAGACARAMAYHGQQAGSGQSVVNPLSNEADMRESREGVTDPFNLGGIASAFNPLQGGLRSNLWNLTGIPKIQALATGAERGTDVVGQDASEAARLGGVAQTELQRQQQLDTQVAAMRRQRGLSPVQPGQGTSFSDRFWLGRQNAAEGFVNDVGRSWQNVYGTLTGGGIHAQQAEQQRQAQQQAQQRAQQEQAWQANPARSLGERAEQQFLQRQRDADAQLLQQRQQAMQQYQMRNACHASSLPEPRSVRISALLLL